MRSSTSSFIHGALAGALGAANMTVLRMAAHRAGWIDAMVPQAVELWVRDKAKLGRPRAAATHNVADQLLHLGYGAVCGGLYGLAAQQDRRATVERALSLGTSLWAFSSIVLFPALKIARPLWRATPREELVNFAAHALYGAATVYLTDELEQQRRSERRGSSALRRRRVG